jgi:endoglucanase
MKATRAIAAVLLTMPAAFSQYSRGVNLSGAEFGQSHLPGVFNTDYTFQSEASFRYFGGRNLDLIRFPIQWERMQPLLQAPLDANYLALLKRAVAWAKVHGGKFIIDVHNFARYSFNENGRLNTYVIDNPVGGAVRVSTADLADLWTRLSAEFKDEDGVFAYDIMNEPHDMGPANWKTISQAVLTAIRANGDNKLVMIPGDSWSSANRWIATHGAQAWISDPANNFLYEAHEYFDSDESGAYALSYDAELRRNPNLVNIGTTRLAPFVSWCRNNNVAGYLGEYGIPNNDARWLSVLDLFLSSLDHVGFHGTYWAAGEWWGDYPLSVQPQGNFNVDRVQMVVLASHLAPGAFTSVSAASYAGAIMAPDSLVAGFGANLASATEIEIENAGVTLPIYVSASQINYVVPAGLAPGHYRLLVKSAGSVIAQGNLELDVVAPALFPGSAQIVRVSPDGSQTIEDAGASIDLGDAASRVFLVLYGTGFRHFTRASLQAGGLSLPFAYAGAQGTFPGLDQVNAELPHALAGIGQVTITFSADGKPANPLTFNFR